MTTQSTFHTFVFLVLLCGSTVTTSAQKLVDISPEFGDGIPPSSVFVDTTGYASLESMPKDTVIVRTYAKIFRGYVLQENNPCKWVGGPEPRCVTGLTMNTSTEGLQAAHDSASRYYPGSIWCEGSRYEDEVFIGIQVDSIENQVVFATRFKIWTSFFPWIIPEPVSVDEDGSTTAIAGYNVYPNPASTTMSISSRASGNGSAKRLSIQILDALGQRVAETEIVDGASIDVSLLGNGAYRAIISEVGRTDMSVVQIVVNK